MDNLQMIDWRFVSKKYSSGGVWTDVLSYIHNIRCYRLFFAPPDFPASLFNLRHWCLKNSLHNDRKPIRKDRNSEIDHVCTSSAPSLVFGPPDPSPSFVDHHWRRIIGHWSYPKWFLKFLHQLISDPQPLQLRWPALTKTNTISEIPTTLC